jgi:putative effector of murein hydrolase LrgA (UPF0299 family)
MRDEGNDVLTVCEKNFVSLLFVCLVYFDVFEYGKNIQEIIPLGICLSIIGLYMLLWGCVVINQNRYLLITVRLYMRLLSYFIY